MISPLTIDFTDDLDLDSLLKSPQAAVNVFSAPDLARFPVRRLPYELSGGANQVQIFVALQAPASGEVLEVGGVILVDVVCDFLLDVNGVPVSSSLGAVVGGNPTFVPGGLMRLSVVVR